MASSATTSAPMPSQQSSPALSTAITMLNRRTFLGTWSLPLHPGIVTFGHWNTRALDRVKVDDLKAEITSTSDKRLDYPMIGLISPTWIDRSSLPQSSDPKSPAVPLPDHHLVLRLLPNQNVVVIAGQHRNAAGKELRDPELDRLEKQHLSARQAASGQDLTTLINEQALSKAERLHFLSHWPIHLYNYGPYPFFMPRFHKYRRSIHP
jgi:hypothetical protein